MVNLKERPMPQLPVVPVPGDETLPDKVDVVVIGGGIVGASAALELAERGVSVALCEKGAVGNEQSGRNWGWVRIGCRDARELPLMLEALKIWPELERRTGFPTGYVQCGIMFSGVTSAEQAFDEQWFNELKEAGVDPGTIGARMLPPAAHDAFFPGADLKVFGGLHVAADGRAEPQKVTAALALGARAKGARILTECAVRGLDRVGGAVAGVVTERGLIACDRVLLAGGVWSGMFLRNHGIRLPQLGVINSVQCTAPVAGGPDCSLWTPDFALRKHENGGYVVTAGEANIVDVVPDSFRYFFNFLPLMLRSLSYIHLRFSRFSEAARMPARWPTDEESPFEYVRVNDPPPRRPFLDRALANAGRAFPALRDVPVIKRWGGMIDVVPDIVPVISDIPEIPGLCVATGFSGHGFGLGPAAGRLAADMVTGKPPVVDPSPFRLGRFSDGSRLVIRGVI
jgi:glycine/D-amino acid oxidase-like deaminating enzyme